jgi:hypothetical protein
MAFRQSSGESFGPVGSLSLQPASPANTTSAKDQRERLIRTGEVNQRWVVGATGLSYMLPRKRPQSGNAVGLATTASVIITEACSGDTTSFLRYC